MIIANSCGFISYITNLKFFHSLKNFNPLLNIYLIVKLLSCRGRGSMSAWILSFALLAFLILYLTHTHINKMEQLSKNITISSKWALLYCLKPLCLLNIGTKPSSLPLTSSISPLQNSLTMIHHFIAFLVTLRIIPTYECLGARVSRIFIPTIRISFSFAPPDAPSLGIVTFTRDSNA
jgi:hypothetical protein